MAVPRSTVLALCVLVALPPVTWAGSMRHDRDEQLHLDLGQLAAYASVGKLRAQTATGEMVFSGVLISPQWVLTVSHCMENVRTVVFSLNGQTYAGAAWTRHPNWDGDFAKGYDLALIRLDRAVMDVAPAQRYRGEGELNSVGTIVGFGRPGTGRTGSRALDGRKRAGRNVIDQFYRSSGRPSRVLLCDFDNPDDPSDSSYGSSHPLNLEYISGPGDSGGGLFIEEHGQIYLAGINSFGMARRGEFESRYGHISGHVRVSVFADWIEQTTQDYLAGTGRARWQYPSRDGRAGVASDDAFLLAYGLE